MTETMQVAVFSNIVTLLIAIGGWLFAFFLQRDAKRLERQQRSIHKLEQEVRARIALEKSACDWLAELTGRTFNSVKLELRNRSHERSGMRPKMTESDMMD